MLIVNRDGLRRAAARGASEAESREMMIETYFISLILDGDGARNRRRPQPLQTTRQRRSAALGSAPPRRDSSRRGSLSSRSDESGDEREGEGEGAEAAGDDDECNWAPGPFKNTMRLPPLLVSCYPKIAREADAWWAEQGRREFVEGKMAKGSNNNYNYNKKVGGEEEEAGLQAAREFMESCLYV